MVKYGENYKFEATEAWHKAEILVAEKQSPALNRTYSDLEFRLLRPPAFAGVLAMTSIFD